jgi:hypothetical protein
MRFGPSAIALLPALRAYRMLLADSMAVCAEN